MGLSFVTALAVIAGMVVFIPVYQAAADDAANISNGLRLSDSKPTVIVSADGKIIYTNAKVRRTLIKLEDLPPYVKYALIAAEDKRFYDHQGVDYIGLGRVLFTTVRDRHVSSGGSTISMQLAKRLFNGEARNFDRKLKDIATAMQIEKLMSKDEILNLYANEVYYGEQAFGLERAALVYFNKHAKELTVAEAAMLSRCVRLPSRVNPVRNLRRSLAERDFVLGVMKDENWITQSQYDEAISETPKLNPNPAYSKPITNPDAGYFVRHVLQQIRMDYPAIDIEEGGYRVETTLNYQLQKKTVETVQRIVRENASHKVTDGAFVLMDADGRILAEQGGVNYRKRQFNVITQGLRQPGSAFKSILYASALERGAVRPNDVLSNAPIDINGWRPQNASPKENAASYSLTTAFALSVNRPAIHTGIKVGFPNVVRDAREQFGIKSKLEPFGALALGSSEVRPIEMLEAYSTFMLGGERVTPQTITRIIDPEGKVVATYKIPDRRPGITKVVAGQMDEILKTPVAFGTATWARQVPNARGKTGTTNDAKDAWFCGYSDGLVGVGWVGNSGPKGQAYRMSSRVFGGTVTVKIWTEVMLAARNMGLAKGVSAAPDTSVTVSVPGEATPAEVPVAGEEPGVRVIPDPTVPLEPDPAPPINDPDLDPASNPDPANPGQTPPPANTPPIDRDPPALPPKNGEEDGVDVEICVDTGMRANPYCSETVTRRFPKRSVPRKVCTLHHG